MAWFLLPFSRFPLAPLAVSLLLPFVPLSTYLAPSSCDRNRPPPSQVACKLTLFAPPFTHLSHPFQLPRTPTTQRLTTTTLGPLRSCYAEQVLPRGFEPGFLVTGSKRVVHWTSEIWWEWSEIAGSAQHLHTVLILDTFSQQMPSLILCTVLCTVHNW